MEINKALRRLRIHLRSLPSFYFQSTRDNRVNNRYKKGMHKKSYFSGTNIKKIYKFAMVITAIKCRLAIGIFFSHIKLLQQQLTFFLNIFRTSTGILKLMYPIWQANEYMNIVKTLNDSQHKKNSIFDFEVKVFMCARSNTTTSMSQICPMFTIDVKTLQTKNR